MARRFGHGGQFPAGSGQCPEVGTPLGDIRGKLILEILYLLIPLSLLLVVLIVGIFWWTVKSGQLDDLEGPAYRVIMDDDKAQVKNEKTHENN
jgi:cbb3-type cytochrome oxidase maturation protein